MKLSRLPCSLVTNFSLWRTVLGCAVAFHMPCQAGLVAHFLFDGDLMDASGNGNHGSYVVPKSEFEVAFETGVDGTPGGAVILNGTTDVIELTRSNGLPLTGHKRFSVAAWVKGDSTQNNRHVFTEGSTTDDQPVYVLGTPVGGGGALNVFVRSTLATNIEHHETAGLVYDGGWHHVAVVDDDNTVTIYIDGQVESVTPSYGNLAPMPTDRTALGGLIRSKVSNRFEGALDDVRLYDHALSKTEVEDIVSAAQTYRGHVTVEPFADEAFWEEIDSEILPGLNGASATQRVTWRVPKESYVSIEFSPDLTSGWTTIGEPHLVLDGMAEVEAPLIGGQSGFLRLVHEPFPASVEFQGDEPVLVVAQTVPVSDLEFFLTRSQGISADRDTNAEVTVEPETINLSDSSGAGGFTSFTAIPTYPFHNRQWGNLQPIPSAPTIAAYVNGEKQTFISRRIQEGFVVPMSWSINGLGITKAKWVIQREPFPAGTSWSEPAPQSIIGHVDIAGRGMFGSFEQVEFELDFGKQAIYGIEEGMRLYARLFEVAANGQVFGAGSNVVTFQVEETPEPQVSPIGEVEEEGTLTLKNTVLGCIETTDGGGDDEVIIVMHTLIFDGDEVDVSELNTGFRNMSAGRSINPALEWPDSELLIESDLANTWNVYSLVEEDIGGLTYGSFGVPEVPTSEVEQVANAKWNDVLELEEPTMDALINGLRLIGLRIHSGATLSQKRQWFTCWTAAAHFANKVADRTTHEVFASTWFQVTPDDIKRAIEKGRRDKYFSLEGDGGQYYAKFRVTWKAQ